ncbi:acyltransferase family protein [Tistrella mobilis]|uniref:Acyltransferase n=1 Tax=Tistrella mobilis (strain KA081020-065) TaxID=1110502 RepID=I3TV17_TISMK|nr:acyltransferase family protein [Tistrella mobilis]AFK56605.1 putative acyltransferase [Tistrella mobilis KA081020-065]
MAGPALGRSRAIDHLRNLVILGLILFHTARLFDTEPWHIKDAGRYAAADVLIGVFNIGQMPLLFFLAGITAMHSLAAREAGRYVRERLQRLGLPLVAGILLVVPPQVYVERLAAGLDGRASPIDLAPGTGFLDFYPGFFDCCYPAANFSWHHLWFLAYLLVYALVLLPVFVIARRPGPRALLERAGARVAAAGPAALLAPGLPVLLGGWFALSPALGAAAERHCRLLLIIAAVATALAVTAWMTGALPVPVLRRSLRVAGEWATILGLLGWAGRRLAAPIPGLSDVTRFAFPFYIVHQTVIVVSGYLLLGWSGQPLVKYLVIVLVSGLVSWGLARALAATALTRLLFGIKSERPGMTPGRSQTSRSI